MACGPVAGTRWTIVKRDGAGWLLECSCGTKKVFKDLGHVRNARSKSCGCLHSEKLAKRNTTHGLSGHELHDLWKGMHARCRDRKHVQYRDYGGRGIRVCVRWSGELGFANFVKDMGERPPGTTIDRKINAKGYSPKNCIWSSRKAQSRNKRNNRMIAAFGKSQCLRDWAEETGIAYGCLHYRIVTRQETPETALSRPSRAS